MRISDWSSDVCSSDLSGIFRIGVVHVLGSREAVCHVTVALAVARVQARAGVRMTPFGVLPARLIRLRGEGGCGFAECLCGDSRDPTLPLGGGRAGVYGVRFCKLDQPIRQRLVVFIPLSLLSGSAGARRSEGRRVGKEG